MSSRLIKKDHGIFVEVQKTAINLQIAIMKWLDGTTRAFGKLHKRAGFMNRKLSLQNGSMHAHESSFKSTTESGLR